MDRKTVLLLSVSFLAGFAIIVAIGYWLGGGLIDKEKIDITKLKFADRRENGLPKGWFLRHAVDLSNEEELNEKTIKVISFKEDDFCDALLYNLTHVAEIRDNIPLKSEAFKIKKGKYRVTFYTKPLMFLKGNKENGFSITINVFDKDGQEVETFPPFVWNNDEIWETEGRTFSLENSGFEMWKKITIDLEFPENSDRAVFGFSSEGVEDYSGEVLLCAFSLEEIK